jgi:hypothetical protein
MDGLEEEDDDKSSGEQRLRARSKLFLLSNSNSKMPVNRMIKQIVNKLINMVE